MFNRKIILRVLLCALAIAAVTGAAAMLLGTSEVVGRVAGTALLVAGACGLMLPLSLMVDRQRHRLAGLIGMGVVMAEFIMAMALIWIPNWSLWGGTSHWEDGVFITMATLGVAGPFAMGFVKAATTRVAQHAGRVGLVLTATVALIIVGAAWWEIASQQGWSWLDAKMWGSAVALGGLGIPAVCSLVGVGLSPSRHWRWLGVVAAAAAFIMALVGIWGEPHGGETIFATTISIAVVVAHANLAMFCPLKPGQAWLVYGTICFSILTAIMVDAQVAQGDNEFMFARIAAAAGIMAACGTLALMVLARLNRGVTLAAGPHQFIDITLHCPRCQRKQKLPLGDAACIACGLRISTQIEEPRCGKCGYLLYMLTGTSCPECGTPIADSLIKTGVA